MDNLRDRAEELARIPIEDANINPLLSRSLLRAGYSNLLEAFKADEGDIQRIAGRSFNEFTDLVDNYYDNPGRFVSLMSREKPKNDIKPSSAVQKTAVENSRVVRAQSSASSVKQSYVSDSILKTPFGKILGKYQEKAKETFDSLCDRHETVLVYQAFPVFSVELEEIRDCFLKLFEAYASYPAKALAIAREFLPDLFLVFVADLARDIYADDNLWGNFFEVLPLNQGTQNELKKLFVDILVSRKMPLYARGEAAYYYFYTALLHGGLSKGSWEELWESSLMPMAKELEKGNVGFGGEISGYSILREIKNSESRYAPNVTVMRMLQKAPDATIAPLFESAMRVATQANLKAKSRDEYVLIDDSGLPEVAIVALHDYTEKKSAPMATSGNRSQRQSIPNRKFVNLPSADLNLDLERGIVLIRWTRKQYPDAFLGDRIDFYIDGEKQKEQYFETRLNRCILDDVEIEVVPQSRYDIELRLMKRCDGEDGTVFEQKSSLEQTFLRSKPGCFEFIRGIDGMYRLRSRGDRITRRRRIAYILNGGYYIEPGTGMTPVSEYEASEAWRGMSAFVYDVEPGASGSIFKRSAYGEDEEVAVWQESYGVHINKHRIIGETLEGLDLYGYAYCKHGDNAGLPYIVIEALDGATAFDDLEISCTCDGEYISVPRKLLWEDEYGELRASQIGLPLELALRISWHSEAVEIVARQISTGRKVIFRYRFAIVPIQEFRLEEAHIENGIIIAQYSFHPRLNVYVTDADGNREFVNAREQYWKRALLKDEFMSLVITSEDGARTVNAKLALAAIDVDLPIELVELSGKRPLCLADAVTMGTSRGEIQIKALGWRYNRNLVAAFRSGDTLTSVLFFKELRQPGGHAINLFSRPGDYVPVSEEPRDCPLTLFVDYGDEETQAGLQIARTEVELLRCREGLGFKSYMVVSTGNDLVIRFDSPVLCGVYALFRCAGRRPRDLAESSMARDDIELVIPEIAAYQIRIHREVVVTLTPRSRLGKPSREYSFDLTLGG